MQILLRFIKRNVRCQIKPRRAEYRCSITAHFMASVLSQLGNRRATDSCGCQMTGPGNGPSYLFYPADSRPLTTQAFDPTSQPQQLLPGCCSPELWRHTLWILSTLCCRGRVFRPILKMPHCPKSGRWSWPDSGDCPRFTEVDLEHPQPSQENRRGNHYPWHL